MTHPGSDVSPEGAWTPPQGAPQAEPEKKSNAKKWASLAGAVVIVGVGGAYALTGGFGIGNPEVGDCVHAVGETDFETTECDADDADYKIVGIEDEKLSEDDFMADPDTCVEFAEEGVEYAFWQSAGMITEKGTVYCAGPL
jgi:hypothetical protein